ncbi:MerR family transcriptional regulator [Candidatus Marinamargulisbacteria bacterium]|nr:MerR family transcriptional regulator [Candidatus Marinamargulisbacteria bacterium]
MKNAAKILGVNPETLRRWDTITKRHPISNYRIYDPIEVESLRKLILEGKPQWPCHQKIYFRLNP